MTTVPNSKPIFAVRGERLRFVTGNVEWSCSSGLSVSIHEPFDVDTIAVVVFPPVGGARGRGGHLQPSCWRMKGGVPRFPATNTNSHAVKSGTLSSFL